MQFKVPQFLEIEDKIFGPFTFKQFIYLTGGGGLCFILYRLLGFWLGILPVIAVAAFSLALAFYRPNDKPFIDMLQSVFKFVFQSKLYIWKRKALKSSSASPEVVSANLPSERVSSGLNQSKLRDLAWSLDILDLSKNQERQ